MANLLLAGLLHENLETELSIGIGTVRLRRDRINASWAIEAAPEYPCDPPLRITFRGDAGYDLAIAFLLSLAEALLPKAAEVTKESSDFFLGAE